MLWSHGGRVEHSREDNGRQWVGYQGPSCGPRKAPLRSQNSPSCNMTVSGLQQYWQWPEADAARCATSQRNRHNSDRAVVGIQVRVA